MMRWLEVCALSSLLSHSRFLLTLRSKEGHYHSLILFRLSSDSNTEEGHGIRQDDEDEARQAVLKQMYVMEASCPHLGADLSHAEIEECETGLVAVCPWHRYDFDLRTGKSEMGLKACTYAVKLVSNTDSEKGMDMQEDTVHIETPEGGSDWRIVELRPVSEEFADPPPPPLPAPVIAVNEQDVPKEPDPVVPFSNPPKTLMQWAVLILNTPNPILKVQRTRHAVHLFRTGQLASIGHKSANAPTPPETPARDASFNKNMVDPGKMKSGRKNRAVMLHALANIEQWAIDLAWDIMARFGPSNPDLPQAFFSDFSKMALDESKHFTLLTSRLAALSPSTPYGSMPVHASLWESARTTGYSLRARLAIIHLVHEARGLDVNPGTIERFRRAGDKESVDMMQIIHADEVTHVTAGHRWFTWCCSKAGGLDPVMTFREEVIKGWRGEVKGPFNAQDREKAGMTREFYENLRGEMGEGEQERKDQANIEKATEGVASLNVQYDGGN